MAESQDWPQRRVIKGITTINSPKQAHLQGFVDGKKNFGASGNKQHDETGPSEDLNNIRVIQPARKPRQHVVIKSEESVERSKRMSIASRESEDDELVIVPKIQNDTIDELE